MNSIYKLITARSSFIAREAATQNPRTTVTAISRSAPVTQLNRTTINSRPTEHLARPQQLPSVDQSGPEAWGRQLPPMQTSGETEQMLSSLSWSSNVQLGIGSLCQGTDAKRGINIIIVQCEVKFVLSTTLTKSCVMQSTAAHVEMQLHRRACVIDADMQILTWAATPSNRG